MKFFFKTLSLIILLAPVYVFAQYNTLVKLPGADAGGFDAYLQAVYATSISLAALLAVIKIVIAGVKWMTTDIVDSKSSAKKDIEGAILGLVVILAAVLILYIINPNIGAVSLQLTPAPQPPSPVEPRPTLREGVCDPGNGGCTIHSCDFTNNTSSWIGRALQFINEPANTLACTVYCDFMQGEVLGTGVNEVCVVSETSLNDVADEIAQSECEGGNCEILNCGIGENGLGPFLLKDCQTVCEEDEGGTYIDLGTNSRNSRCVIELIELGDTPIVLECPVQSGFIQRNCTPTISLCERSGGSAATQAPNGQLEVLCTPNSVIIGEINTNQYETYVAPNLISNPQDLNTIAAELGLETSDLLFTVNRPYDGVTGYPVGYMDQINGVCRNYANEIGISDEEYDEGTSSIQLVEGTNYATCVNTN